VAHNLALITAKTLKKPTDLTAKRAQKEQKPRFNAFLM